MNNEIIAQFPAIEKLLNRLKSFRETPIGENKTSNDVQTPGHGWEDLAPEFNHYKSAIAQLFIYYGDIIKGGVLPDGLTSTNDETYGPTLARRYVDAGFRVFYASLEEVTPILSESLSVCKRLYKDPAPEPTATQLYHSLLKAEGVHVVEAIRQAVRLAQNEYNAFVATISSPGARVDRVGGKNLEPYYKKGVHRRVISLAEALQHELPGDESAGFVYYLQTLHWDEFFNQNKSNLQRISETLQKLLDQLSD